MSSTTAAATAAPTTAATAAPTAAPTTAATTTETTAPTDAATAGQYGVLILIVLVIFIIVAIYCVIKSLMCFGKSGSTAEKIIGVIIAFFMGPFYLLYLNFNEGYCNAEEPIISSPQMVGGRRRK
jgi:hypothetical protein